jgi:hypothetical protein
MESKGIQWAGADGLWRSLERAGQCGAAGDRESHGIVLANDAGSGEPFAKGDVSTPILPGVQRLATSEELA